MSAATLFSGLADDAAKVPKIINDPRYKDGLELLQEERYEEAISFFGELLQLVTGDEGEMSLEAAPVYYQYGNSLLLKQENSGNVFAEGAQNGASAEAEEDDAAEDKENAGAAAPVTENKEEDDAEDDIGDMELAWQMLEIARVIYSKEMGDAQQNELATVYMRLGDLNMEQGNFESSCNDFTECLSLRESLGADERELASVHYSLGTAHNYAVINAENPAAPAVEQDRERSLEHYATALQLLVVALQKQEKGESSTGSVAAAATEANEEEEEEAEETVRQSAVDKGKGKGKGKGKDGVVGKSTGEIKAEAVLCEVAAALQARVKVDVAVGEEEKETEAQSSVSALVSMIEDLQAKLEDVLKGEGIEPVPLPGAAADALAASMAAGASGGSGGSNALAAAAPQQLGTTTIGFGAPTTTVGFGAPTTTIGFGAPTTTIGFGARAPASSTSSSTASAPPAVMLQARKKKVALVANPTIAAPAENKRKVACEDGTTPSTTTATSPLTEQGENKRSKVAVSSS